MKHRRSLQRTNVHGGLRRSSGLAATAALSTFRPLVRLVRRRCRCSMRSSEKTHVGCWPRRCRPRSMPTSPSSPMNVTRTGVGWSCVTATTPRGGRPRTLTLRVAPGRAGKVGPCLRAERGWAWPPQRRAVAKPEAYGPTLTQAGPPSHKRHYSYSTRSSLMPLIQGERSRRGSSTRRMPGMASAIALNIRSTSSSARFAPRQ